MTSHQDLIKKIRHEYTRINKVYCPVIKESVYFNSKGFYHLRYDVMGRKRSRKEQIHKLKLVKHLKQIVKSATIVDEIRFGKAPTTRKRKNGRKAIREVFYCAIVGNAVNGKTERKIKVILRKVGNGNTIFWSVMRIK